MMRRMTAEFEAALWEREGKKLLMMLVAIFAREMQIRRRLQKGGRGGSYLLRAVLHRGDASVLGKFTPRLFPTYGK